MLFALYAPETLKCIQSVLERDACNIRKGNFLPSFKKVEIHKLRAKSTSRLAPGVEFKREEKHSIKI